MDGHAFFGFPLPLFPLPRNERMARRSWPHWLREKEIGGGDRMIKKREKGDRDTDAAYRPLAGSAGREEEEGFY